MGMNVGGPYIAANDPCHIHWEEHNKSLTVAECPMPRCQEWARAKADGSLYAQKYRGTDKAAPAAPEPVAPDPDEDSEEMMRGML